MLPASSFRNDAGQFPEPTLSSSPIPRDSKPVKRISRACLRCRQRKSKCNLGNAGQPGVPPCESCVRDRAECVLATSKRGGKRVRRSVSSNGMHSVSGRENESFVDPLTLSGIQTALPLINDGKQGNPEGHGAESLAGAQGSPPQSSLSSRDPFGQGDPISSANIDETIASTELHATSEALNMLSHVAQLDSYAASASHLDRQSNIVSPQNHGVSTANAMESPKSGALQYELVSRGLLTADEVARLVTRFKDYYHPYLPLAPRRSFDPEWLQYLATREPHLLTAMITVAARDLPGAEGILHSCSTYMHQLVSEIIAGKKCDVEAVEALLLLAEWEPQDSLSEGKEVGCGEEDRAAWMHVGLALRIGYFLGLDRTAIKHEDEEKAVHLNRRRVTWAVCYVSDRQLSARVGRAFWSRGPVAVTGVGRHGRQVFDEFRPLQPETPDETDYASILQANLDLTQLFSNVHDVLYSGMGNSMQMMLAGNYVKYIDDFRRAIEGWKSAWGTLTCPPNIKATLQMSYEYLRLYTSAYAFQATVTRAARARSQGFVGANESPHNGVPSLPDARFVYESVDAAKSLLSIITSYIDAENCLRFLPLRFSLYCVNSAVFLYKAWSFEVLSIQEKLGIRHMIKDVIRRLQKASVRPNDFTSRYSELLDRLWQRKDTPPLPQSSSSINHVLNNTTPPSTTPQVQNMNGASSGYQMRPMNPSAGVFGQQDEFSWLDLQAVGELVSGEPGFGGVEGYNQGGYMTMGGSGDWGDQGMVGGEDFNRFF